MTHSYLIIGGDGIIGAALASTLATAGMNVQVTTRRANKGSDACIHLDLSRLPEDWPRLPGADVWFLCAAVSKLADCDADPEGSRRVNVDSMTTLAKIGAAAGAQIIFLSSDKVFDGTVRNRPADDPCCPVTVYGQQKAETERNILALGDAAGVVRFTKVLNAEAALITGWIEALGKEREIRPFKDMTLAPIALDAVVDILMETANRNLGGVLQVSGPRDVTYAEAARHIARGLGADPALVKEISARDVEIPPAHTPPHSTLDTRRLESEMSTKIPDALDVIEGLYGFSSQ